MTTGVARRPDDSRRRNGHVCEITDRTRRPTVLRRRSGEQGRGGDRLPRVHLGTQALRTGPMADADARGAYAPGPLASSACSRSRQRSSTCSQPTLTRRRSSGTTWRSEGYIEGGRSRTGKLLPPQDGPAQLPRQGRRGGRRRRGHARPGLDRLRPPQRAGRDDVAGPRREEASGGHALAAPLRAQPARRPRAACTSASATRCRCASRWPTTTRTRSARSRSRSARGSTA